MATVPGPKAGNKRPSDPPHRKEGQNSVSSSGKSMVDGQDIVKPCAAAPSLSSHSVLEELPVEVINNILSYLVHPRSRLPGLTENESS